MTISTSRLEIVPFGAEHVTPQYMGWLNDPEVVRFSEQRHILHTLESCQAYAESFKGTSNLFWALVAGESGPGFIGTMTAYHDIHNNIADVGILIGDRSAWGQGYGQEAWQGVCKWLFEEANVRKITAGTVASNKAMLAIMEKSGMVPDGIRQDHYLIDGKLVDVIYMALFIE